LVFLGYKGVGWARRSWQEKKLAEEKAALPSVVSSQSLAVGRQSLAESQKSQTTNNEPQTTDEPTSVPSEVNWDVPFAVQAPNANWDYMHEEACEEAAMLMAKRFFYGQKIAGADDAETGLQQIIEWEKEHLGFFESTTAEETAQVMQEMFSLQTQIIANPSVEQIKRALAEKKLVLVPSAGRQIGNPFYKSPGPLYHMLLLKGYTPTQFITNDAGTKRGENYPYDFKTVLNANHDWNGGDVDNGAKRVILVWK
jgi:hypothetical protein